MDTVLPNAPTARLRHALRRWVAPRPTDAVTTVMIGSSCQATRVLRQPDGTLRVTHAVELPAGDLRQLKARGLLASSLPVLVLGPDQRQLLTLDRPEVPDEELAAAARFPLAEQIEAEPAELLCTALSLPRINDANRPQLLAVGARLAHARSQLEQLAGAGISVRSIDIADSALRGIALLSGARREDSDGWIVLASLGGSIAIGLLWGGDFCALRTLALPVRSPRDGHEFEEQLALHIQRTTDHFERQATALAIRKVLVALPDLEAATRESLRQALPMSAQLFTLEDKIDIAAEVRAQVAASSELGALACVAAARLLDATAPAEARA